MSLLDRLLNRMLAQKACLAYAFEAIGARPGVIFELGLGKGRTYSHLREHLPGRDIYVFERELVAHEAAIPPASHLIMGDMAETLPVAVARHRGQVVLAHTDVGGYAREHNRRMAELVGRVLPPALAPGGLIVSDLDLDMAGAERLPRPAGAPEGWYHIYRL